ncbi:reverse transcriptase domain-containing protein [Tanacetum coccineum]
MEEDYKPAVQHQRRVNPKIHDVIKKEVEKLLDAGLIYPISDSPWVRSTNPLSELEKSHFMVKEGIVLGHKISKNGIEVDKAKVDVIAKLPHPITVKGVRSFLAFETLKIKLTETPILIAPDWDLPFELMCDASDFAIGAVLGQRHEKHFRPIHYASKTMSEAKSHYTTMEKEMLAVVYAFEKFWSYLILNKKHYVYGSLRPQISICEKRFQGEIALGRQSLFVVGTSGRRANISGIGGNNSGQQRVVKCFNCQREGHMARQCPMPKRKRDATWFRDKVLLVEAQGSSKVLNEEESEFLADPGVAEAKAVLMANLSSYRSDVLSEVPHYEHTHNDMLNKSVQEMQYSEQTYLVNYPENKITSDSNIIPYSPAQQDAMILYVFEQLSNQVTNYNKVNKDNHKLQI